MPEQHSWNLMARDCVAVRLRLLNRMVTNIYDDMLRPFGLRVSQLNLLVVVATKGPLRPTDLSRFLKLEKSTLSRDMVRLLAKGWLEELPGDDGRSHSLRLTRPGAALLDRVMPAWNEAQAAAGKLLGKELVGSLSTAVRKVWSSEAKGK